MSEAIQLEKSANRNLIETQKVEPISLSEDNKESFLSQQPIKAETLQPINCSEEVMQ